MWEIGIFLLTVWEREVKEFSEQYFDKGIIGD